MPPLLRTGPGRFWKVLEKCWKFKEVLESLGSTEKCRESAGKVLRKWKVHKSAGRVLE